MPLYFSRPLTRGDYVLAKFAALSSALFILIAIPLVVLLRRGAARQAVVLGARLVGCFARSGRRRAFALVLAGIGLLIASPDLSAGFEWRPSPSSFRAGSRRRQKSLQGVSVDAGRLTLAGYFGIISPFTLVDGVQVWALNGDVNSPAGLQGTLGGLVFLAATIAEVSACYLALQMRYRRVSGA